MAGIVLSFYSMTSNAVLIKTFDSQRSGNGVQVKTP